MSCETHIVFISLFYAMIPTFTPWYHLSPRLEDITRQPNKMNFYQLFKIIDAASLGMSEDEYSIILETFLVSDEALDRVLDFEDEDLISKRKKRGKNEYTAHDRFMSLFSQKYLHHSRVEEKIDEYSRFGNFTIEINFFHPACFSNCITRKPADFKRSNTKQLFFLSV